MLLILYGIAVIRLGQACVQTCMIGQATATVQTGAEPSRQGNSLRGPMAGRTGSRVSTSEDKSDVRQRLEQAMAAVAEQRDTAAFAELFDFFAPRLKAYFLRQGEDHGQAEELSQEAMLTVWRRAETFDASQASVSTWVFTVARNKRIDALRKSSRPLPDMEDPALAPDGPESAEAILARAEEEDMVQAAIKKLPPEQLDVVRKAYFEFKAHSTIAEETTLPLGTIKSRLRLALVRLRKELDEELI